MILRFLLTNAFWSLLSHLLARGCIVIAAILLARSLGTQEFAIYSYFQLTVSMIGAYAAMGMGMTASRFFAELGADQSNRGQTPVGTLWCLSIIFAIVSSLIMFVLPKGLVDAGLGVPRWLMALGVLALALNVVPSGAILGLERYKKAASISAISGAVLVVGALYAATIGSARLAMLALICSFFIQSLGQTVIVVRHVGFGQILNLFHLNKSEVLKVFNVALPMLLVTLMSASGTWILGRIILAGNGGEQAFAYYAIGLQWFALTLLIPGMLARVALPMIIRTRDSVALVSPRTLQITRVTALLAMVAGAFITGCAAVLGPWLMSLYGGNYPASRWFLATFMLAGVVLAPVNTMGNAIIAYDGQWLWLGVTVVWFVSLISFGFASQGLGQWAGPLTLISAALVMALTAIALAKFRKLI